MPRRTSLGSLVLALVLGLEVHAQPTKSATGPERVVVLIPGITGSELVNASGERIWPPRMMTIYQDFASLRCDERGLPQSPSQPRRPIEEYYESMARFLQGRGYQVFRFAYDWRLSNTQLADQLRDLIARTGSSKVDIVAHSMGGIVASTYVARHGGERVRRLVTLGTPFLGTPGAVKTLELGDFVRNIVGYFLRPEFTAIFRNNASWYQLLPNEDYFKAIGRGYVRKLVQGETDMITTLDSYQATLAFISERPWANKKLLATNGQLHQGLDLARTLKKVDAYFVVGFGERTVGQVDFVFDQEGGREVFATCEPHATNGDGAVVLPSATIGGQLEAIHPGHAYYIQEEHGELFNSEVVQAQVGNILQGQPAMLPGFSRLAGPLDDEEVFRQEGVEK